jgi:hypothetical protein
MQIALVAVVLLAGMWFTVLKPKPVTAPAGTPAAAQPTAPGVNGLTRAVAKAKAAATTSDAANAKIQAATGAKPAAAAKPSAAKAVAIKAAAAAKAKATATAKATKPAAATTAPVDPSDVLLAALGKGKTVVLLFSGNGADDRAARKAVHRAALADKSIISGYASISKVAAYSAITSGVEVTTAPTILVIGKTKKAIALTGLVDSDVVLQTVGDARRATGQGK